MKKIKNLQNLIKLIKKVHTQSKINKYNIYTNLRYMDKESARIYNILNLINKYKAEFFMKLMEIFIKNINYIMYFINIIYKILPFLKELIIYLIEKYYYKFNSVYFILKVSKNINTFNFFITLNKIKYFLNFTKKQDKPYVRLLYYYTILFIVLLYYTPITWFLLRVLTDQKNWMIYFFDQTNLMLLT